MNIVFLFVSFLILSGGDCEANTEINELNIGDVCGSYTYQVVKPLADQLERLQNNCDNGQRDTNHLTNHEKMQQLELKIVELQSSGQSKDLHIKDLQATISELQNANHNVKQLTDSVNKEIVQLKSFIKEEIELSKSDQFNKNSRANSENIVEMKSLNKTLKGCQLSLSESQSVVRVCQEQLGSTKKNIDKSSELISQLIKQVESKEQILKESQRKLASFQYELMSQKEVIQQKELEILKLKEHIKETEVKPTSCIDYGNSNSVHNVEIPNFKPFPVLCNSEIAGPGWTVMQQRVNGGEDFYRDWKAYKNGFGDFTGDFFLGLEKIYRLTNNQPHELYIHMERFDKRSEYVRYDNFKIAGEEDKYRLLSLESRVGNVLLDRMTPSVQSMFSTYDNDNLEREYYYLNLAEVFHSGWWHAQRSCNLNGIYYQKEVDDPKSNWWSPYNSLKTIKMLIRPRGN